MQTRVNRRKFIVSATCSICGSVILPSCAQVPLTNRNQLNLYDSNFKVAYLLLLVISSAIIYFAISLLTKAFKLSDIKIRY